MTISWQEVMALVIVTAAVSYLARVAWQSLAGKKTGGCTTCSTCPTAQSDGREIVQIGQSSQRASTPEDQPTRDA